LDQSSHAQGRLIYRFAFEAFPSVARLLQSQCGAVETDRRADPLASATVEFALHGALLTLDCDTYDNWTLLSAGPKGRAVLEALRPLLDASAYPVVEESEF
jgi:hypothetical protein